MNRSNNRTAILGCSILLAINLSAGAPAPGLAAGDLDARFKLVWQLARERNDRDLVARVEQAGKQIKAEIGNHQLDSADRQLRELEPIVSIDPGGWSMGGLKLFHPTPAMLTERNAFNHALEKAMLQSDLPAVQAAIANWRQRLGDQAGLPDARRPGTKTSSHPVTEEETVGLFLKALKKDEKFCREIAVGRTVGHNMLRVYAGLLQACCDIRPAIQKHQPDQLTQIDSWIQGASAILTRLQQPDGHFPFPDLRGQNIRFGEMIDHLVASDSAAVKDGWVTATDPSGGSQFDTGLCGIALLAAGTTCHQESWSQSGLRAADWASRQPCVFNFNYNAFSVSLLAHGYRTTQNSSYLASAIQKFRIGVAPGQVENGRWLDAHNARTVYHLILLRGVHDLWEVLPNEQSATRAEIAGVARKAIGALLDEYETAGITTPALEELLRHEALNPQPDPRLRRMIELTASVICEKCTQAEQVRTAVPLSELAALRQAWKPASARPTQP